VTIELEDLKFIDKHWAVNSISEDVRRDIFESVELSLIAKSLGTILDAENASALDINAVENLAMAYEIAAIEGIPALLHPSSSIESRQLQKSAEAGAYRAFELYRVCPLPTSDEQRILHVLHVGSLAYCGERWSDLRRWLKDNPESIQVPNLNGDSWDKLILYKLFDCWVRLFRKNSWDDLSRVAELVSELRSDQKLYEANWINQNAENLGAILALRLTALYHAAKATERLALYMLQGEPISIQKELDQHFEAAVKAANASRDNQLEMLLRWLYLSSRKMVAGSVWWVAHAVNSRVTKFVTEVSRSRGLFELLPPQRVALQEQGLLDQANRAVVVDMPTSGGKTQLAQFRILQALNQFAQDDGWVAYVAPTRALVSQITRRLRADFSAIGVTVEQLTGAVEVDAFEEDILNSKSAFQVLVATPEKLQFVMRNKKVARPLALLVMDEAHNIEDIERGLRIELLLATVKQESPKANFLLLMPFVPNAQDLALWLGDSNGKAISLGTTAWQPNERIVGVFDIVKEERSSDWSINFETLATTQRTINLKGRHSVGPPNPLKKIKYSQAKSVNTLTGAIAKEFSKRGTSISVSGTIPHAWGVARKVAGEMDYPEKIHDDVALVQRFLATEISAEFELIDMLGKGVGVHHAGLPSEVLSLIEWLTESGHIKVLCATTTIAQGLNFPVSSVFLATTKYPYGVQMSSRSFWNLAGRAGRIGQDSVGVVGIAAGKDVNNVRRFVSNATGALISRMEGLLDELQKAGSLKNLDTLIMQEQWTDFRSYIAHLWNEKKSLDAVINEAELTLRNTFGFGTLRSRSSDVAAQQKANALLDATKSYVRHLADHPENASLADSTGFSPEGVRTAFLELQKLENKLTHDDWQPSSLFGEGTKSVLPDLMGIMMKIPQLEKGFEEFKGAGKSKNLSEVTQAWVSGKSIAELAVKYFSGDTLTDKISNACRSVYRDLANNGSWGLSALSKMPTAGLDFDNMDEEQKRALNNLPAMIYHGVKSDAAVLMRMQSVPRSIAESVGSEFRNKALNESNPVLGTRLANEFLNSLSTTDWARLKPDSASMSGEDYMRVWKHLSGNK